MKTTTNKTKKSYQRDTKWGFYDRAARELMVYDTRSQAREFRNDRLNQGYMGFENTDVGQVQKVSVEYSYVKD